MRPDQEAIAREYASVRLNAHLKARADGRKKMGGVIGEPENPPPGAIGWLTGLECLQLQIPRERLKPSTSGDFFWFLP